MTSVIQSRQSFPKALFAWSLVAATVLPFFALPSSNIPIPLLGLLMISTVLVVAVNMLFVGDRLFPLKFMIFIFVFQNLLIGVLNPRAADPRAAQWLLAYTGLLPSLALLAGMLSGQPLFLRRLFPIHAAALVYLGIILISLVSTSATAYAAIPALRNFTAFIILFYAGLLAPCDRSRELSSFLSYLAWILAIVVLSGFLEAYVFGDYLWGQVFNIQFIAEAKNISLSKHSIYSVPSDFYTPVNFRYYRRMASILGTPVTFGYFAAFAVYFFYLARKFSLNKWARLGNSCMLLLAALAAPLCLVKGCYQIVATSFLAYVWIKFFGRARLALLAVALSGCGVVGIQVADHYMAGSTIGQHINGLLGPFKSISVTHKTLLFGNGLGTGGTVSARLGGALQVDEETGAESGIGSMAYQTGLLGVVGYLTFNGLLLSRLGEHYRRALHVDPWRTELIAMTFSLMSGLIVNCFFQENALAPIPSCLYLVLSGLCLSICTTADTFESQQHPSPDSSVDEHV